MPMQAQTISTSSRNQMIDLTDRLRKLVTQAKINDGMLIVYVPHTTAGVTINENADPDVKHDMLLKLSQMIPKDQAGYEHAEGNSDSHVKTALVGNSVTVLIENGQLQLGRWQGVYFCEFDGPRERQMYFKAVKFT
jgi:secondary thiamine-phosphate synthase enzyme